MTQSLTTISTGLKVIADTTATYTLSRIKGRIHSIEIQTSASNAFKIYSLKDDNSTADVYIMGGSGSTVTVAADTVYYPRVQCSAADGTGISGIYDKHFVEGQIKIDISSATASDTCNIIISYEPA